MPAVVFEFLYRFPECGLKFANLAENKLWKSKQYGSIYSALSQIVDNFFNVGRQGVVFGSMNDKVTPSIDTEIICPPIVNSVCFDGSLDDCAQFA